MISSRRRNLKSQAESQINLKEIMSESVLDAGTQAAIEVDQSKGNFSYPESHKFDAGRGLSPATVDYICDVKDDAEWV